MGTFIQPADLAPFAMIDATKAAAMIADAEALAILAAPALDGTITLTVTQLAGVKAILRTAILRWEETGSGALTQESIGPYSMAIDTRSSRYGGLTDGEVLRLRRVTTGAGAQAASVDTAAYDGNATLGWGW